MLRSSIFVWPILLLLLDVFASLISTTGSLGKSVLASATLCKFEYSLAGLSWGAEFTKPLRTHERRTRIRCSDWIDHARIPHLEDTLAWVKHFNDQGHKPVTDLQDAEGKPVERAVIFSREYMEHHRRGPAKVTIYAERSPRLKTSAYVEASQ